MSGIANSVIVLAEVRPGAQDGLRTALAGLEGNPSPFAGVPGTHFARWAHVPGLPGPDGAPLPNGPDYLLLCADVDLSLLDWSRTLCERAGAAVDAVMGACVGWPGSDAPGAVHAYLAAHNTAPGFTVATHRRATVTEIRQALRLRRELRRLAVSADGGLPASELRAAWRRVNGR